MAKCKHKNIVLKRVIIFFLGLIIGFVSGDQYGQYKIKSRVQDRIMKQAEKPVLPRYRKKSDSKKQTPSNKEKKQRKERVPR
tara:strand:+ start:556 stop:801 length:246 start_codon:yes stop_codon:yes gene_type:complete